MKFRITICLLLTLLLADISDACFVDDEKTAWLRLPENAIVLDSKESVWDKESQFEKEITLELRLSLKDFNEWKEECGFDFSDAGNLKEFDWTSEEFMGHISYDLLSGQLRVQALRVYYKLNDSGEVSRVDTLLGWLDQFTLK
jgi:hypothetical protein